MEGIILFLTILISLFMGYSAGIKTKRKRVIGETKSLKNKVVLLEEELSRMKTIKRDYQIRTGIYKKKGLEEFRTDINFIIELDQANEKYLLSLLGLLSETDLCKGNSSFDLDIYMQSLKKLMKEKTYIEIDLNGKSILIDTWDIQKDILYVFNKLVNMKEYEMTNEEMKNVLYEEFAKRQNKKFGVHSYATKKIN